MTTVKRTIKVKKYSDVIEEIVSTAVAITPGYLLEEDNAGKVKAHSVAGGNVLPMFALEDEMQGNGVDDNYAVSVPIQVWIPYRGDMVYAWLKDGETVVIGDFVESAGDGTLQKHVADVSDAPNVANQIVGTVVEALDLSPSSNLTAIGRLIIRII